MLLTISFALLIIQAKAFTRFFPREKTKDYVLHDPPSILPLAKIKCLWFNNIYSGVSTYTNPTQPTMKSRNTEKIIKQQLNIMKVS